LADEKGSYSTVQFAGEMNNWNPSEGNMVKNKGHWEAEIPLNPGTYQYQLVIDGKWILDPNNPDEADNNIGGVNSLLTVSGSGKPAPRLYKSSTSKGSFDVKFTNDLAEIFVFWQNSRISEGNIEKNSNGYTISIPKEAGLQKRSHIRVWACNNSGVSNDLLVPLEYGNILTSTGSLTRNDKEASVMYFMLVDRFINGDVSNDDPVKDSAVEPMANYYGGDLAGINQKITDGYFSDLGVNTLWLSPIVQNPLEAYVEFPAPHRKFSGYHDYH